MKINDFAERYYSIPEEARNTNDWYPVLNNFVEWTLLNFRNIKGEYDDKYQIAWIGATKAIHSFDISKGIKFTTFATRCITNELLTYRRKYNRYILEKENTDGKKFDQVSFDENVKDKENMVVSEVIGDEDPNFNNIDIMDKIEQLRKMCTPHQNMILDELMADKKVKDIVAEHNLDSGNVSRARKMIRKKYEQLV